VVRSANGKGDYWTATLDGIPDDYEDADGTHVLDIWQAIERGRALVRGQSGERGSLPTWADTIDDYAADLAARGGSKGNATQLRHHLKRTPALLNKPVALLTATELKRWRNDLLGRGIKPATVVRVLKSARASLNLATAHDPRIQNRDAWRVGLSGLTDTYAPVNKVLSDSDVLKLVAAAYALDPRFGLVVDVLASTGTRTGQACRLLIADLQADRPDPRVMMPSSHKGKGRKNITRRPVPIPVSLAHKLKHAAGDRDPGEPLLTRADGSAWNPKAQELWSLFGAIAERSGIEATAYSLRHSSIVRALLAGTPTRVVASMHDTSTPILERVYSAFILDHADMVVRRGLLDTAQPAGANVVSLPRGGDGYQAAQAPALVPRPVRRGACECNHRRRHLWWRRGCGARDAPFTRSSAGLCLGPH
jgi:integrase